MIYNYLNIISFIVIILISMLSNLVNKIDIKSLRIKQNYLFINRFVKMSKDAYLYFLRAIIYLILFIIIGILMFKTYNLDKSIFFLYGKASIVKSIVSLILSIVVSMKIFFITAIIIIVLILKKKLTDCISNIKWIENKENYSLYTKLIRPIVLASIEGTLYCVLLNGIGTSILGLDFLVIIISLSFAYGIGKMLITYKLENRLLMFSYGFWICFVGVLLYGFTGNFLYPVCLFIINTSFWAFKS